MSYSAMAGNPLLISPEKLLEEGLLTEEDFANLPAFPTEKVDFEQVAPIKIGLLKKACENFKTHASPIQHKEFAGFCDSKAYWLDNYALFMTLKDDNGGASWHTWEPELVKRQPQALDQVQHRLNEEIFYYKFIQFEFFRQWSELKSYANMRGIDIIGDIPIYVAHDSADVWAHPDIFSLDEQTGEAAQMAGVPPDYFSATGQLWGNPVYNWEELKADVAVQPQRVLVRGLHPGGERVGAQREELGERVQHERAAETAAALGAGDGELLDPPAPVVEQAAEDPPDLAPVAAGDPAAVVGRDRRPPRLQRPLRVPGHLAPRGVDVDQRVDGAVTSSPGR